ncbi:TrlF family AAA-like ATPase [Cellulosimicrobium cellulans]|uniref:TrlF family AAA-like ATPase n=1 Tax=Cellulosimicrobium cellulans TaxID=1710 RepID=UPI001BA61137|nr:AAA family ATPase [Cellulosimicrobium cellulans]QUB99631.1 AAA family ATPase [Cellulosimicrobium cellulans]
MTEEPEPASEAPQPQSAGHAGARWWSIDIHAHSPASFDYGGLEGEASSGPKPSFDEWIQAYVEAGVDGIVVTDHNSHEGIDAARQALSTLCEKNPQSPSLVIFPGVEITATGGIHILGVFDPSCNAEIINQALILCRYDGTRGASDQTANMTVADIAQIISDLGGICIPAHADQPRGVFSMDERELAALGKSSHLIAVEVVDDAKLRAAETHNWVPVLGSDAHHLTTTTCPPGIEAKAPGTHLTLIKAETLDLDGIRLALTDPDESVRRCRGGYEDPNATFHGHINRIRVFRGGVTEEYRLGPWMNCLIGGRGVGKSTIVELLRLALGRSHELDGPVADDLRRFSPRAEASERWWDATTEIAVDYTKDQRLLRVTWSGSNPEKPILHLWTGESWEEQSGRVVDRAPVRIFSQKQIYELATSPQNFLAILDDMPSIQRSEWDEQYEELQLRFRGERNKLRRLLAETERADRIRGQLQEIKGRLRHLAELRASEEYTELESTEARIREAAAAHEEALSIERRLARDASTLRNLVTDNLRATEFDTCANALALAADLMERASAVLADGRETWQAQGTTSRWDKRVAELNTWLSEKGGPTRTSAEQTRSDRQREAELEAELREVMKSEERHQEQQRVIDEILAEISTKRTELFIRRREYTGGLSAAANSPTKVEVHQQGDVANIGNEMRRLLGCPESFETAFAKDGIAVSLLAHEPKNPRFPEAVAAFKNDLIEFVQARQDSAIGKVLNVDRRFYARLANADTFDLVTDIMLWYPEDLVSVRYRPKDGGGYIPVDRGSPGQKTAALLTVILQMGTDPLVLDQPEDDLENKLIRGLAVETLKSIKSNRQLVVSTHNANVVVTSASENIIVLEHGDIIPAIEAAGTLQNLKVKENVCEILEGGEEAIKTRYLRLVRAGV